MKYSAYAECEIIHSVNCEISPVADGFGRCEMKFAFSHLRSKYFTAKLFHLVKPNFTRRRRISLKKERASQRLALSFFWRRHPDLNWGITVLQTSALPLGYGAEYMRIELVDPRWSGLRGSNPPPRPWQGRALPNELNPQKAYLHGNTQCQFSTAIAVYLVPPVGIEPTPRGFSVLCSTN